MKKQRPLIISILGIVIIISALAVVYKIYFTGKSVKETVTPPPARVAPARRPLPPITGSPGPAKIARTGAETKMPDMSAAGGLQKVDEKTVSLTAYEYNANGRRDPFATLIVKVETERKKGAPPLESYAVNEFKLTAILWSGSGFYALVSSPDGKNFTLREGTAIGLHGGKVDKIKKDSVIIKEFLKDYRGTVKPSYTVIRLHREEE